MEDAKTFWNKYELAIVVIITLLAIYLLVVFNQKINFLLGNELILYLTPNQKSLSLHYGNISKVDFDVSIDNVAYCTAYCSYSFNDRSKNELIDKGIFELGKGQHFRKSYELSVKRLGSGQDIYNFNAKCRSIRSFLCLTKGIEKTRTSLVIVNYDLTETEKELKKVLKENITKLLNLLANVDAEHQKINQKFFELGFKANLANLTKHKIDIDDAYDKSRVSIENLRSLWAVENYLKLSQLFNESLFENLSKVNDSIATLDNDINGIVKLHNGILSELSVSFKNLRELDIISDILEDKETLNRLSANIRDFNGLASEVTNNTFESYKSVIEKLANSKNSQKSIIENSKGAAAKLFFKSAYLLKYENDFLCKLKQNCKNETSIKNLTINSESFLKNYPNTAPLKQNCDSLNELEELYAAIRNETLELIKNKSINFSSEEESLALASSFKDNEIRKINNSYFEDFERIKSENKTSLAIIGIAGEILPKNTSDIENLTYNQTINLSLYLLSKINISPQTAEFIEKCQKLKPTGSISNFNFEPVKTDINYTTTSKIDTNLSDNPPICCVFNECNPCCRDDSCRHNPKTFPVIFLHGHSLAKDNSPEFSLDSFNKLQSKLEEDGYLNAGIISLYSKNEQLQQGIWGLSGKPVTVKASYYFDAFRKEDKYIVVPTKSENIDTYALRLKELIEMAKERTNKPKANIIAHSMGGLVARRYIQIFGESDIDKLIMIATPNKGITGAISDYCGIIGENRECRDMQENSLFINKLNEPSRQPKDVKLSAIVGTGCSMNQGNGDGIVIEENAKLGNAAIFYVNGTCGGLFGENLHTEMLNIDKYNGTFKIVREILKE